MEHSSYSVFSYLKNAYRKVQNFMRTEFDDFQSSSQAEELYKERKNQLQIFIQFTLCLNLLKVFLYILTNANFLELEVFYLLLDVSFIVALKFIERHLVINFGFYASLIVWYLEITFWQEEINVSIDNAGCLVVLGPVLTQFQLSKTLSNWKWKSLYVGVLRLANVISLHFICSGVSQSYIALNFQIWVAFILTFYEGEQMITRVYRMNVSNCKEKEKWMNLIQNLPFFVFQYRFKEKRIYKHNSTFQYFVQGSLQTNFEDLFEEKQTMKLLNYYQNDFTILEDYSLSQLIEKMISEQELKISVKLKKWKKNFIIIQSPIDEEESIFIMVDNSLDKELQVKNLSEKMVNLLYQSLSHKFMTPINSLKAVLYVLRDKFFEQPSERSQIDACMESIFTLEQLIQNLNDLQISQSQNLRVQNEDCMIHELLNDCVTYFQNQAQQKKIQLQMRLPHDFPERIVTDIKRIKQILFILLGNAIKYTSKGFVLLEASLDYIQEKAYLIILVKDSGCGIESRILERAFKMLNNLRQRSSVNCSGIGLGLTILKRVATALEGTVTINSELNEGTEIKVQWPIEIIENFFSSFAEASVSNLSLTLEERYLNLCHTNQSVASSEDLAFQIRSESQKKRILIVDDDSLNLYALSILLRNQGDYEVEEARNGEEAIEMVTTREKYNLVIMDVNMPVMNGVEAAKKLREMNEEGVVDLSSTPIYVHSAIQETLEHQHLFNGKLSKPVVFKELIYVLSIIN